MPQNSRDLLITGGPLHLDSCSRILAPLRRGSLFLPGSHANALEARRGIGARGKDDASRASLASFAARTCSCATTARWSCAPRARTRWTASTTWTAMRTRRRRAGGCAGAARNSRGSMGSSSLISPRPSPCEVIVGQNGHCFRAEQLTCCAELGSKPNRATLRAG